MTTLYLVRHSEPFRDKRGIVDNTESILVSNMKSPLSVNGEHLAEKISNNEEFNNLDEVWSSNYVRTISTAKYFANRNGLKVNVTDKLNERIHGINSWDELPADFEEHQFKDMYYKLESGESQKEVRDRTSEFIDNLLLKNKNKRILIVGHSTATAFLLSKWCDVSYSQGYKFNGTDFFDGKWNYCEIFKLTFDDDNNLLSIINLKLN